MSTHEANKRFFMSLKGTIYGPVKITEMSEEAGSIILVVVFPPQPGDAPRHERKLRFLVVYQERYHNWIIAVSHPTGFEIRRRRAVAMALAKAKSHHDFQENISDDESVDGVVLNVFGPMSDQTFDAEALGHKQALDIFMSRVVALTTELFKAQELIYKEIGLPADMRKH